MLIIDEIFEAFLNLETKAFIQSTAACMDQASSKLVNTPKFFRFFVLHPGNSLDQLRTRHSVVGGLSEERR